MIKKFIHGIPIRKLIPHKLRIKSFLTHLMTKLCTFFCQAGPDQSLIHGLPEMNYLLSCHQHITGFNDHIRLQPLLCRQQNVCIAGKRSRIHIHMYDKIKFFNGFCPTTGFCQYTKFVSGTVDPHSRLIRFLCQNCIQHTARMTCIPDT